MRSSATGQTSVVASPSSVRQQSVSPRVTVSSTFEWMRNTLTTAMKPGSAKGIVGTKLDQIARGQRADDRPETENHRQHREHCTRPSFACEVAHQREFRREHHRPGGPCNRHAPTICHGLITNRCTIVVASKTTPTRGMLATVHVTRHPDQRLKEHLREEEGCELDTVPHCRLIELLVDSGFEQCDEAISTAISSGATPNEKTIMSVRNASSNPSGSLMTVSLAMYSGRTTIGTELLTASDPR